MEKKTIYISGPISEPATGQPREGWQKDFLCAEEKLKGMGFGVINPVDISGRVDKYIGGPQRADYIVECLETMHAGYRMGQLDAVYVIGQYADCRRSIGVTMELQLAELLGLPVYAEMFNDNLTDYRLNMAVGDILDLINEPIHG